MMIFRLPFLLMLAAGLLVAPQGARRPNVLFIVCSRGQWRTEVELEEEIRKHDQWVKDTLASASRKGLPVSVVMHHPLYTQELDEKDTYTNLPLEKRKELLELFEKHGVVAVLTGHAHRIIINDHKGIQMVTGETTSTNHGAKVGFRLWHIEGERPYKHESVPLEGFSGQGRLRLETWTSILARLSAR